MVNAEGDVERLLVDKKIRYMPAGRDLIIQCLNPEHVDANPSLRIDKVFGYGQCFSCGFRVNIFNYFGINNNTLNIKVAGIKEKIDKLYAEMRGLDLPTGWTPFNEDFRGVSRDTLREYGAFNYPVTLNKDFEDRIVFPLKDISGKIICFLGRHKLSDAKPRYLIYPSKTQVPIFPTKLKPERGTLVLVEGIFDALNLIDKGMLNVAALMGVTTLASKGVINRDIVGLFKLQGVTKLVLLFDGDEAGRKQSAFYEPLLIAEGFIVNCIDLPDDTDPGELSASDVEKLKGMI